MFKRSRAALVAVLSLLAASPAMADYPFQAGGQTITQAATVAGGKSRSHFILTDAAGNPVLTSGNPGYFSLSGPIPAGTNVIGGVTISGTVPLPTGAATAAAQTAGNAALGAPSDAAWDGSAANASHTSLLKALWTKLSGLLTVDTVVRSTAVDRGAVLSAANVAQTLIPVNSARRGIAVQNRNPPGASYDATLSVFYTCQGTATADFHSLEVPAGALYETPAHHVGTGACSFMSPTASTPVYLREF